MVLSDLLKARALKTEKVLKAINLHRENDPYIKNITAEGNIAPLWLDAFITKLNDSFENNTMVAMGNKEKAVYNMYTRKDVYTVDDIKSKVVLDLDKFLATILPTE